MSLCSLTSQLSRKQVLVFPFPLLVLANMDTGGISAKHLHEKVKNSIHFRFFVKK